MGKMNTSKNKRQTPRPRKGRNPGRSQRPANRPKGRAVRNAPVARTRSFGTSRPQQRQTNRGFRVKHKELVRTITPREWEVINVLNVNPGIDVASGGVFSWLCPIAQRYEKYMFHNIRFTYLPRCSTSVTGSFFMAPETDINQNGPTSMRQMSNYKGFVSNSFWTEQSMTVAKFDLDSTTKIRYVRGGQEVGDLRLYDAFKLCIGSSPSDINGLPVTSELGYLYVEYDVELFIPQINDETQSMYQITTTGPGYQSFTWSGEVGIPTVDTIGSTYCPNSLPNSSTSFRSEQPIYNSPDDFESLQYSPAAGVYMVKLAPGVGEANIASPIRLIMAHAGTYRVTADLGIFGSYQGSVQPPAVPHLSGCSYNMVMGLGAALLTSGSPPSSQVASGEASFTVGEDYDDDVPVARKRNLVRDILVPLSYDVANIANKMAVSLPEYNSFRDSCLIVAITAKQLADYASWATAPTWYRLSRISVKKT